MDFSRLELLMGKSSMDCLSKCRVFLFGLGGVGSWCAEALVRSGIGSIYLADFDTLSPSNINRQLQATDKTIGLPKTEALYERLKEINPECEIKCFPHEFSAENSKVFDFHSADYVIDAIDTLPHKLDLIEIAINEGKKFFSSMGMAGKLDPTRIRTADIWNTSGCPLAKIVRTGLRKRNFKGNFTAVYSTERLPNIGIGAQEEKKKNMYENKKINGSAVCVTAAAGMVLCSLVLMDIYKNE